MTLGRIEKLEADLLDVRTPRDKAVGGSQGKYQKKSEFESMSTV